MIHFTDITKLNSNNTGIITLHQNIISESYAPNGDEGCNENLLWALEEEIEKIKKASEFSLSVEPFACPSVFKDNKYHIQVGACISFSNHTKKILPVGGFVHESVINKYGKINFKPVYEYVSSLSYSHKIKVCRPREETIQLGYKEGKTEIFYDLARTNIGVYPYFDFEVFLIAGVSVGSS